MIDPPIISHGKTDQAAAYSEAEQLATRRAARGAHDDTHPPPKPP